MLDLIMLAIGLGFFRAVGRVHDRLRPALRRFP